VDGTLTTFGCVEWESELFLGVMMRARCYPFKLPKRLFDGMYPQVQYFTYKYAQVHSYTYCYVLVCTGNWYILVFTSFTFFNFCVEGLGCVQDTIVVVPPYPYSIADDIADVPF
jgi:hypothetical protein